MKQTDGGTAVKYCTQCGAELEDNAGICHICSAAQSNNNPAPACTPADILQISKSAWTWGLVGLVSCFIIPVLGIIFSSIGLGKAGRFKKTTGSLNDDARAGRTMSVIGLVISIIRVVGVIVLAILFFTMMMAGFANSPEEIPGLYFSM